MAMGCLQPGPRLDGGERFGDAWGVIRDGGGPLEAAGCAWWQPLRGSVSMLRRRFLGPQEAVLRILHAHHPMGRPAGSGAVTLPRRRRSEDTPGATPRLWRGPLRTQSSPPALARRWGQGTQAERGTAACQRPAADPTDHHAGAGPPEHAGAQRLRGREALEGWGAGHPLGRAIQRGTGGAEASVRHRMVPRRPGWPMDVVGCLAPTPWCLGPQRLVHVVLAPLTPEKRRALVHRRAHHGLLGHRCDSRLTRPLHAHRPRTPCSTTAVSWERSRRGERSRVIRDQRLHTPARPTRDLPPQGSRQGASEGGGRVTVGGRASWLGS